MIHLLESSSLSFRRLDMHHSTFCHWLQRYQDNGVDGLEDRKPTPTVAWWLCTSMSASDVSDTLGDALCFAGLDQVKGQAQTKIAKRQRPVLDLGRTIRVFARIRNDPYPGQALSSADPGQDRALASVHEKPDSAEQLLSAR